MIFLRHQIYRQMKKILLLITLSFFLPNSFFGQSKNDTSQNSATEIPFSKTYNNVNDFEKILASNQIASLNTNLKSFEKKSGNKIFIITTSSIKPYTDVTEYTYNLNIYLANTLKLNPSFLIVLSKELRQIQIQSSFEARNKLTEEVTRDIITNSAIPDFKKGDYGKGLENAVLEIIKKLE